MVIAMFMLISAFIVLTSSSADPEFQGKWTHLTQGRHHAYAHLAQEENQSRTQELLETLDRLITELDQNKNARLAMKTMLILTLIGFWCFCYQCVIRPMCCARKVYQQVNQEETDDTDMFNGLIMRQEENTFLLTTHDI